MRWADSEIDILKSLDGVVTIPILLWYLLPSTVTSELWHANHKWVYIESIHMDAVYSSVATVVAISTLSPYCQSPTHHSSNCKITVGKSHTTVDVPSDLPHPSHYWLWLQHERECNATSKGREGHHFHSRVISKKGTSWTFQTPLQQACTLCGLLILDVTAGMHQWMAVSSIRKSY